MTNRYRLRKRLLASLITAAVATSAAGPTISWAQTADAQLRGKAAPNAEVTAKNLATGAVRRTKAADDGSYALVGLPAGSYQVDAGPGTERSVTLSVASTSTLDFAAAPPPVTAATTLEGVSVTAATLADVKTSEVGGIVSLHQIQTIPQISRNFLEFADTVPGMVFTQDAAGHTSLRGGAQNNSSVNVYIDGVGQKSYVKEGGVSGQFSSQGNPFPQLAIGEYKVITSNYKAEYDQISGAAVTAETKSGGNEFHGEIFGNYTDDKYRKETPAEEHAGKQTPSEEKQYGFAIGGPIIQDQMHFFLSYEAKRFETPVTVITGVSGVDALLPSAAQAELGPATKDFNEDLYFGKIDWEFSDRDRIEISAKVRQENQTDNVGGTVALSAGIDTRNDDTRIDARWQHSADNWFNELLLTHEKAFNDPSSFSLGNGAIYTFGPNQDATILTTGPASPLATQHKGQEGPAIADNLTFNNLNWLGDHVIKVGFKFKDVKLTAQDAELNNPQFYYNVDQTGTASTPYKAFFPSAAPGLSPVSESKNKQFGTYIQDDWALNEHLTLNLGVRWDYEESPAYLDYVTPPNVVAALNAPNPDPNAPAGQTYAQALALGGVNVNDYISNGHNRSAQKDEWAPRLGFSYDIGGDEQHVVFGGAGRSYDRDLFDYLQLEQTKQALSEFTYYFQDPATGACKGEPCVAWDPKYLNGLENLSPLVSASNVGKEVDAINNNLKAPYSDQFSLGMRNRVGEWNTSAAYARINSKNGLAFTLGNRYPSGAFWQSCGATCASQPWGNGVPGFGALILGNNGIETKTNQVLLSADKPYTRDSGWSATFAYTYTDAKQNRDINEHYSFDEATIHDYPFILSNAASKHRLVATGSIDGPWGLLFAGKLTLATPIPKNDLACYGVLQPTGSFCTPAAGTPGPGGTGGDPHAVGGQSLGFGGKIYGYRDIDFQTTKDFDLTNGISAYIRLDILNVFNFHNYSDYVVNFGGNGAPNPNPVSYYNIGNITGVPRTFKLTAGFRF